MATAIIVDTMIAGAWLGLRDSQRKARWQPLLEQAVWVLPSTVIAEMTTSRSLLGTMNEFAYLADNDRWQYHNVDLLDLELSLWLPRVPCSPLLKAMAPPTRRSELSSRCRRCCPPPYEPHH